MLETVNKETLLAWLKQQAEGTLEGLMEDISTYIVNDWEIVNDETPIEKLPLLINHDSPVTALLAKQRMAGKSVYDTDLQAELTSLMVDQLQASGDICDMGFLQGELYQISCLYQELGEYTLAIQWKSWAWFSPYN
jgi:hypothetical protein